jgi:glutathione reductase (NADPH)
MTFDYDLFVIGGGSGGVRSARVAAGETGAKVGLAEQSRYGGTCVIRGCVPKKLMVFASEFSVMTEQARAYGWPVESGPFNWGSFQTKLNAELDRLEGVYRSILAKAGVETFDMAAELVEPHVVELADGTRKTAKHILLAVGGRPVRPDIPGAELGITSNEIFNLQHLPKSILIIGGGYIASEFAGIMTGLGVATTQFYRGEQILRGFDDEARNLVTDGMRARGVDLRLATNATALQQEGNGICVVATDGTEAVYDQVMFATGRRPNTDMLGLAALALPLDANGAVIVDDYSQTAVPSIYAVGDVTDRVNLTPVAIQEGIAFVKTVFQGAPTKPDHDLIPTAIFTQPEFGTIGLSEAAAQAAGPIKVYATTFRSMRESFGSGQEKSLLKLITDAATDKVIGCHIVAPAAGEMIQLIGVAIKMGATKADFDRTMAVHPTLSEELVTMGGPVRMG